MQFLFIHVFLKKDFNKDKILSKPSYQYGTPFGTFLNNFPQHGYFFHLNFSFLVAIRVIKRITGFAIGLGNNSIYLAGEAIA